MYQILDFISKIILSIKAWHVFVWTVFMTSLALIVLFSGQYTTELYYGTLLNIGVPIGGYIAIQRYKFKYRVS